MTTVIQEAELAGMVDDEGRLDRPFPALALELFYPIKVDAERDVLMWDNCAGPGSAFQEVPPDLLTRFIHLGLDAHGSPCTPSPKAIMAFARSFGPLNVPRRPVGMRELAAWRKFQATLPEPFELGEPLAHWRYYTAAMRTAIAIAAALRNEGGPAPEDWQALLAYPSLNPKFAAMQLSGVLNEWLRLGEVAPVFSWPKATAASQLYIQSPSLFGVLALQLAQSVAGTGWANCQSCGLPFAINLGARGRRRRYCPQCTPWARGRLASRRHYQKVKDEKGKKAHHVKASRKP
jgi:hypothetical protein